MKKQKCEEDALKCPGSGRVGSELPSLITDLLLCRQVDTQVCSRRILISNLPKMDLEMLLNKLEIHFSKKRNGGGEVDSCEMMADTWTVVIAFVDADGERSDQMCLSVHGYDLTRTFIHQSLRV